MRKTLETAINGLKLWTERLVKRSADEVRGEIPAIPAPKQADWNQNDETAIDHIKGRTHYERIGFKQIPIGTYNDHAPMYTDYNVGPYAWDYTNGITLRVDGVVYQFETFTKSDFDSNLGCYGYWVGAPLVRGQIADSSEYPFHFRIFEKDNEYAHVEFADGTDNHTFEVFCTEIKQLDEKYIPESIARKSDIPQGGGTSDIPDTLPNPHPLTFTGAVEATYDGSTPVEVEIPMGGGGANWNLISSETLTEDAAVIEYDNLNFHEVILYFTGRFNDETDSLGNGTAAVHVRVNGNETSDGIGKFDFGYIRKSGTAFTSKLELNANGCYVTGEFCLCGDRSSSMNVRHGGGAVAGDIINSFRLNTTITGGTHLFKAGGKVEVYGR